MKKSFFIKGLGYASLFTVTILNLNAQSNSFDSKKHQDTIFDRSSLQSRMIQGQAHSQSISANNSRYNIQTPISPILSNYITKDHIKDAKVKINKKSGLPIYITTKNKTSNAKVNYSSNKDSKTICFEYLYDLKPITKLNNPKQNFKIKESQVDDLGKTHIKLHQTYNGIKIYDAEVIVHLNNSRLPELFNGNYKIITGEINTKPQIDPSKAVENVILDLSTKTKYRELNVMEKQILEYEKPEVDTIIYTKTEDLRSYILAYQISIHPNFMEHWEYIVDANTGNILHHVKQSCHVGTPVTTQAVDLNNVTHSINSIKENGNYYLNDITRSMFNSVDSTGKIKTLDAKYSSGDINEQLTSVNNTWDKVAVSAHYNAGVAYEYFKNKHGRNSIDGLGGDIISFINVVEEDGSAMDNAYWNGKAIFYGNGNTSFKPLAASLDVAGHEMSHGVVDNSAKLKYEGESGAINESFADIFGCMMDSTDWLIGEDIVKLSVYPSGALRSLSNPHNGGNSINENGYQPQHVNEQYFGDDDNGGVHINSGIPNYAFYKFATALNNKNKAAKIYYRALAVYLTASSQFIDLRLAVVQSAKDLYGENSNEAIQAGLAFDAVGIIDGINGDYSVDLPVNPGDEYILSYDTDGTNSKGFYRSTTTPSNFVALSNKIASNKPSITDDGEVGVFVGTDKKIYAFATNPVKQPNFTVINSLPIWSSVAVSKDGSKMAAVTADKDTSIYVYDFSKDEWARFKLYNPTYTQGVKSGGPIYADALEWSYDNESIIYDCFNRLSVKNGKDIEYWDINVINVWNTDYNDFSSGDIVKLFNNLEVGESIGNPSLSKNSPYIIAFDYLNENTNTHGIIGLDIEKNELDVIATNNTIGWPSFNKFDNKVAFTTLDGSGNKDINYVVLNSDKISSNNIQKKLIDNAKWPVYFTVGIRSLVTNTDVFIPENSFINLYPNPTEGVLYISGVEASDEIRFLDLTGREELKVKTSAESISVESLSKGFHLYEIRRHGEILKQGKVIVK